MAKYDPSYKIVASEAELAWAAGFLDGEGCFTLYKRKKTDKPEQMCLVIKAAQKGIVPLDKLQKILGGKLLHSKNFNRYDRYDWVVNRVADIKEIIEAIYPYLERKSEEAEIIYAYALTVNPKNRALNIFQAQIRRDLVSKLELIRNQGG